MRLTLKGLLQAAAVLTVLFSVLTVIPADNATLQLFTHFRFQYLAGSVLLFLLLAAMREPRYALALFLTVVLNGSMVVPWFTDQPPVSGDTELKLIVANLLSSNTEHEKLFDLLEIEDPDLIVLVEVSPQWDGVLDRLHTHYAHSVIEPRDGNFGIALFSRVPLDSVAAVDTAPLGFPTIIADLRVGDEALRVVGTHPMIPVGAANYDSRNEHLDGVARLLQSSDGPRMLVGDLNATMWDLKYTSLENKTWLRNARQGFGILPTWPTFMPLAMIPIDHVLVSEDIGVRDIRTGARIGSDHLPLVVTISL